MKNIVLLISPATDLDYPDAEMQALMNLPSLETYLVRTPCTVQSIYAAVDRIKRCHWLHIFGHGSEGGVHLDNGEVWSASEISMVVQTLRCSLTWINTCDSIHLAKLITEHTRSDCIANLTEANDRRAWQLPVYFARQVATLSPLAAFRTIAAADRNAIYVQSIYE